MAAQKETRIVELIINGKQANLSLNEVKGSVIALTKSLSKMKEADDPELYRKKVQELRKVKAAYDEMRTGVTGASTATSRFFSNFKTLVAGVVGGNLITAVFTKLAEFIPNLIRKNAELSDSFADVAKTTGLTITQVESLSRSLKSLDTRTGRKELLLLARDAGKLGITGQENILGFVRAADKINVALGEDLGRDAIKNVGKLVSLFGIKDKYGLEDSMIKTASAMNELGMASEASEGFIVDFLRRMGGIAPLAGISIDQTMALGATLDALGQTSETSSTALSKMFVKMASEAGTYAKIAGVSVGEFSKMMNENALGAFIEVLRAAGKTKGGIVELTNTLGDLGIEGGRATGVFGVLANNVGTLEKQMGIANKAFTEGTSITEEFNIKNNTLGANLDRLGKKFNALFTSGAINKGLTHIAGLLNKWTTGQQNVTAELEKTQFAFNREMEILKQGNFTQEQRLRLISEINTNYKEYLPNLITEKDSIEDINAKQEAGNQLLFTKIMLMRYEKERTDIITQQQQAMEGLYKTEKSRQEIKLDQNTGFTPDQKKQLMGSFQAVDEFNKSIVDGTDARLQELEVKFKSMAANVKLEWEKIKSAMTTGETSVPTVVGAVFDNNDKTEKKKEKDGKTLEEIMEFERKLAEDEFKLGLELTDEFYTRKKNKLAKLYLDGEITHEEYEAELSRITESHLEARLNLSLEYNNDVASADEALLKHKLNLMEQEKDAKVKKAEETAALQKELEKELQDYLLQIASDTANAIASRQSDLKTMEAESEFKALTKDLDKRRKSLDDMYERGLISKSDYDEQVLEMQKKQAEAENELKIKQWKFDRQMAITNSIIQTTEAVIRAIMAPPGPPATTPRGIMIGALGAIKLGMIMSQPMPQFYSGGMTVTGAMDRRRYNASSVGTFANGGYYSSPSVGLIGERGPELVIPNWLYSSPPMANVMRALEASIATKQFAFGGPTTSTSAAAVGANDGELKVLLGGLAVAIGSLNDRLSRPIEAKTFFERQKYEEYTALEDKARAAGKF